MKFQKKKILILLCFALLWLIRLAVCAHLSLNSFTYFDFWNAYADLEVCVYIFHFKFNMHIENKLNWLFFIDYWSIFPHSVVCVCESVCMYMFGPHSFLIDVVCLRKWHVLLLIAFVCFFLVFNLTVFPLQVLIGRRCCLLQKVHSLIRCIQFNRTQFKCCF